MRTLFSLKSIAAVAASLAALLVFAAPAMAKQCVWNKAGFVVRVDWFAPGSFTIAKGADGFDEYAFTQQPTQTDTFPLASGRCINRGTTQYDAVISACGLPTDHFTSRVIAYPSDWPAESRLNDCSIFISATPSLTRWLDVWGTFWDPQTGPGGPL
ncbi:hypothetical protein sos41_35380 [Alphaproteobacteria bacterium SO-S41]|nr:hypothetical protein sos41_35380 [Alphaproteobacteria bacterium SO-S41]